MERMSGMKPFYQTIQAKIVFITLIFSLIMGLSVSAVSYVIYTRYLRNDLIRAAESNLQYAADSLDSSLDSLSGLVRWCQNYSTITDFAQHGATSSSVKLQAWEQLNSQYLNLPQNRYITRILVTSGTEEYIQIVTAAYSSVFDILSQLKNLDYLEECLEGTDYNFSMGFISDPFRSYSPKQVLPMIRPIYHSYSSAVTGCVFLEVSTDLFADTLNTYAAQENRSTYLIFPGHTYRLQDGRFTAVSEQETTAAFPVRGLLYRDTSVYRSEGSDKSYCVVRPMTHTGWYLAQSISGSELQAQSGTFLMMVIIIFMAVLFTGILLNLYLQRLVNTPVRRLTAHMERIAGGDFSYDPSIEWENEFGQIGRGMNIMSANIVQLMEKRLADEKEKQDYEYRLLQSQINPHFLYNTLNSIKWMATIQNAPGIADMTTALSRLLKSISKGNHSIIPLSEELSLLRDYFTIQKYRYGGTISMEIRVDDEELYRCSVMRFTLQPIVENSIFHGIEPKGEAGLIIVHASSPAPDLVEITVTDNGIGMTPEKAASILTEQEHQKSNFFREFGIASVHKRIQYEFGDAYGLSVTSVPGEYTTMTVRLPKKEWKGDQIC